MTATYGALINRCDQVAGAEPAGGGGSRGVYVADQDAGNWRKPDRGTSLQRQRRVFDDA